MTEHDIAHLDPARLARQLNRCRQHGLDDLDLDLHNKPRVPEDEIADLAYVARAFCAAIGVTAPTRGAAMLRLIQDGLAAYAEQGNRGDSEFVKQFFFERSEAADASAAAERRDGSPASGSPPAVLKPRKGARIKDLATELHLSDKRLAELRNAAFIRFATFLITYVAEVSHVVPAVQVQDMVAAAAANSSPMMGRRLSWFARGVLVAGLVAVGLTAVLLHRDATVPSATATTISGYVECWPDATKAVEGVWIKATSGGSGWAAKEALPDHPNVAWFSYTLPYGGSYIVDVGCGGSPKYWEFPLHSVTAVLGDGYYFTCYDAFAVGSPYTGQCRL